MKNKELEQKLMEVDAQLKALGDLNALVLQSQNLPNIISDAQTKKSSLESFLADLPARGEEVNKLAGDAKSLSEQLATRDQEVSELVGQTEELQKKVLTLVEETRVQLGKAANEKLANSFEQVKGDLKSDKSKFFWWLVGAIASLVIATAAVVWWQLEEIGTLYHLSFPVRIALLSPIIYLIVFIKSEYNRARNLIEEYTFKAAIARSFEAYKEIVEGTELKASKETLGFILKSISDLYSSPMVNIKNNRDGEKESSIAIASQVQNIIKDGMNKS
ncbi:MAG: hypothetical protein UV65_C0040G0002 [Parcubacteria group bacterium GW2011_GWF2_43_11]|nr:MAG: hypothetical protein UV65_C0040G0002 [Parcubacteria group bacterium GW2011_GWF2_43_11]